MNRNIISFIIIIYFSTMLLTMIVALELNGIQVKENIYTNKSSFFSFTMYLHLLKINFFVYFLLILGVITFKITTIINIISNGVTMGIYLPLLIKYGGFSFLIHGSFELFGLFLGAYIGLSSWRQIKRNKKKYIVIFLVGCSLILISGLLENYVTPIFFGN